MLKAGFQNSISYKFTRNSKKVVSLLRKIIGKDLMEDVGLHSFTHYIYLGTTGQCENERKLTV